MVRRQRRGETHPVRQKSPNAWGLYDMHGNVWECCQDWWGDRYYATSPMDDPTGAPGGSGRVCRGGAWDCDDTGRCRAAFRTGTEPSDRNGRALGFRLARLVSQESSCGP